MIFYLGTHRPNWLAKTGAPLFISRTTLQGRKSFPRARGRWALDSGGFSVLSLRGKWDLTAVEYAAFVDRVSREVGSLDWAAPMDWMCEPWIIEKTGFSVEQHQEWTINSVEELRSMTNVPVIPVLQGWSQQDYEYHIERYARRGFDLSSEPLVGVGSVCRRQATDEIRDIITMIHDADISIHGFGVKMRGIQKYADKLASADSMAWSYRARRDDPLPGHEARHKNCANCIDYALLWRDRLLEGVVA